MQQIEPASTAVKVAGNGAAAAPDPAETREWVEALEGVIAAEGPERARELVVRLVDEARTRGVEIPANINTPYINTIPSNKQTPYPGNNDIEQRIRHYIRWNAVAMVLRSNREGAELGGHLASFQSSATLFDVGFNNFWNAPSDKHGGDLVYFQGHSSPGIYARAFLEGRLTEEQLMNYRAETGGKGLSSYPHPWLMPDFWQFATVSMGLGPLLAVYQARFLRYLQDRGIVNTDGRNVWAFIGDGEIDEPESLAGIGMAGREKLGNLIYVVNCNLQRLDGPVRGNGKIIQELEGIFRGAGWKVIKVIWGRRWDKLLERDKTGKLIQLMTECVDGDYQTFKSKDGAFVREHFFGRYPETRELVAHMSDDEVWDLNRGGHDPFKLFAAYKEAVDTHDQPVVILAKTIKGYALGEAGEGTMVAHQQKKMAVEQLRTFRDRLGVPIGDEELETIPFLKFPEGSIEENYLRAKIAIHGSIPQRSSNNPDPLPIPDIEVFAEQLKGSGERSISTTMAFVRLISALLRNKEIGPRIVPIVSDEARTFGMEGLFRQIGIYSNVGQLYEPADADQLMWYKESKTGQLLEEGITEAGAMAGWIAAATSYSTSGKSMIPFFIYYSMFGFQRVGDLAWAAGDMRSRGFLIGATAGRTTLNGEGLQHQDGHSHLFAAFIPNCVSYDPTYAYELAVIFHDGLRRMFVNGEDVYYYLTVMNENYMQPPMPPGAEDGILRGMYLLREAGDSPLPRVQLMGSGTILREVEAAAELLKNDWNVAADVWSCTSFNELRRDGLTTERWNMLHPMEEPRVPFVAQQLLGHGGPIVASTDYIKSFADQIRPFIGNRPFTSLGTDGFGRSDERVRLRDFFEVDRRWVTVAALRALADDGAIDRGVAANALAKYGIDPEKPEPVKK
jgi:pyruvate dehydrogenase E1 component